MRHWKKSLHLSFSLLLGVVLGAGLLSFSAAGLIYDYQDTVQEDVLPDADVIVCLAGGRGRIKAAGDLWYRYWVRKQVDQSERIPKLFVSGMGEKADWTVFSSQVSPEILERLKPSQVILETESKNTYENAEWFVERAQKHKWSRVVLVTASYHMRRAKYIFEKRLREKQKRSEIYTFSVHQSPFSSEEWIKDINGIRVTVTEFIKWISYRTYW